MQSDVFIFTISNMIIPYKAFFSCLCFKTFMVYYHIDSDDDQQQLVKILVTDIESIKLCFLKYYLPKNYSCASFVFVFQCIMIVFIYLEALGLVSSNTCPCT